MSLHPVHPSVQSQSMLTLPFKCRKSTDSFSQTIALMVLKFHMKPDLTAGLQNDKIQLGQKFKMAAITKITKTNKINFYLQNLSVYLAEILYGALVRLWFSEFLKWRKSVAEIGHSDLLPIVRLNLQNCHYSKKC